jgi:hypothetical protein
MDGNQSRFHFDRGWGSFCWRFEGLSWFVWKLGRRLRKLLSMLEETSLEACRIFSQSLRKFLSKLEETSLNA